MDTPPRRIVAIYPGSFDPITNGHLDLIRRGARLFDRLIVAVLRNQVKQPLFSTEERTEMLAEAVSGLPNVSVDSFDGLLVNYATSQNATVLLASSTASSSPFSAITPNPPSSAPKNAAKCCAKS